MQKNHKKSSCNTADENDDIRPVKKWSFSIIFVTLCLLAARPMIVNQLLSRADAYYAYGLNDNAIRQCKKALFIQPHNNHAWLTLGDSYKSQNDIDNAVQTYLNAINADASNWTAHFRLAMLFALQQDYTSAIPHFEAVRQLAPLPPYAPAPDAFNYHLSSLEMLALCYERTDQTDKAIELLGEALRQYPTCSKLAEKLDTLENPRP